MTLLNLVIRLLLKDLLKAQRCVKIIARQLRRAVKIKAWHVEEEPHTGHLGSKVSFSSSDAAPTSSSLNFLCFLTFQVSSRGRCSKPLLDSIQQQGHARLIM